MPTPSRVPFDIREIPFSTRGSWLDVSPVVGLHRAVEDLHLVSHRGGMHGVLRLEPRRFGAVVVPDLAADSTVLTWSDSRGSIEVVFGSPDLLRIRGRGTGLRIEDAAGGLTPFTGTYLFADPVGRGHVFTSYETGMRYRVTALTGTLTTSGVEALGAAARWVEAGADGADWEIAIEETTTARAPLVRTSTFDDDLVAADDRFAEYLDRHAPWRTAATPAAELAVYVLWSATVSPAGFVGREAVLMSKHWMDKVWSWDHCFNALALAPGDPAAALDQFLLPFDHQEPDGALPDSITHSEVLRNYVKPPIHGWALALLRADLPDLDTATLTAVHDHLAAWTRFWLDHRRAPGRPLPHYQHGNDSGWDNSTAFDDDRVLESPDLAAFLAVQLDVLAELAHELDDEAAANDWERHRDAVLTALHDTWTGTRHTTHAPLSGRTADPRSLLTALPLVAGTLLGDGVADRIVETLHPHLTTWGLATEPPGSPSYEPDGYWRGPIWAPSTFLLVDGLRRTGHHELADEVSVRFRRLCETSGFAENFDALSGKGLRDRAYTWTASTYLVLARAAAG